VVKLVELIAPNGGFAVGERQMFGGDLAGGVHAHLLPNGAGVDDVFRLPELVAQVALIKLHSAVRGGLDAGIAQELVERGGVQFGQGFVGFAQEGGEDKGEHDVCAML